MEPTGLVISGATGRMGRSVARMAAAGGDLRVLGGLDREGDAATDPEELPVILPPAAAGNLLATAAVIVDFSAPEFLRDVVAAHAASASPAAFVIGTTGLGTDEQRLLDEAASRVPVLTAANFSVGVNLLLALARRTAATLGEEFDIEIVETHHRRKEDAPSGTALALGEAVAEGRGVDLETVRIDGRSGRPGARPSGQVGFHALRGGDVIGEHQVHFIGSAERIELTHRASDRQLFAAGALRAARWIRGKAPGRYSMNQVLGL